MFWNKKNDFFVTFVLFIFSYPLYTNFLILQAIVSSINWLFNVRNKKIQSF